MNVCSHNYHKYHLFKVSYVWMLLWMNSTMINKKNKFIISMQPKKMSLTLHAKCGIKQQMDEFLQADYRLLNQHPHQQKAILQCQLTHNNPIIKKYIQVVEQEYNIPNPLNTRPSRVSSKKKIELSILNASRDHFDTKNNDKRLKKLTLTGKKSSNQSSQQQSNQNSNENAIVMTPKFLSWEQESDRSASNYPPNDTSNSRHVKNTSNSLNRIASKEKPIHNNNNGQLNNSTAKKENNIKQSQYSYHNFESRATIKKIQHSSPSFQQDYMQSNDSIHSNPIITKMNKKNLQDYCRPGRISSSIIQEPKKLKIKDSYRYCIGCQEAILQNNIRIHEKQCKSFQQISCLASNHEVLKVVKDKIASLQTRIPARTLQVEKQHAEEIRNRSASLVRESRRRQECSPQSSNFRKDYESIMEIGKKWCSSIQEVNKLRWFTRIAQKLEAIVTHEQ